MSDLNPINEYNLPTGFPSPAADWLEKRLELNDLVERPTSTFYIRAKSKALSRLGIQEGDLLVVDRSLAPQNGDVVIAFVHGEMLMRQYILHNGKPLLQSANLDYPTIAIEEAMEDVCWGVVRHVVHTFR